MDMLIDGEYVSDMDYENVINPYDGEVIDKVPISHLNNVDRAIEAANNAKKYLQEMSAFKVSNKLFKHNFTEVNRSSQGAEFLLVFSLHRVIVFRIMEVIA